MTSKEAIKRMKYRIDTAAEIAGRGEDGKAFDDMELAIEALENQEVFIEMLVNSLSDLVCNSLMDYCDGWCEKHCKYDCPQRECYLKYADIQRSR